MVRKNVSPRLVGSKVVFGRKIGEGRHAVVRGGKIVQSNGQVRRVAIKSSREEYVAKKGYPSWHKTPGSGYFKNPALARQNFLLMRKGMRNVQAGKEILQQKVWLALKKAGLPVPSFSKIDLRRKSPTYSIVFMEELERKYGKLYSCENDYVFGRPHFLTKFTLRKDRQLLALMAQDLSKIHSIGYGVHFVDLWHFYKKGDTYGRVIVDFEEYYRPKQNMVNSILNTMRTLSSVLGKKEFTYFVSQYLKATKNTPTKKVVEGYFGSEQERNITWEINQAKRKEDTSKI